MRIAGVTIPDNKRVDIALTYLSGIGRSNVKSLLTTAKVNPEIRVKDLTEVQVGHIVKALDSYKVEGDLRAETNENIKRLQSIGSYRGNRHTKGLPARGQRTRSNARTKRGKRKTIGAIKKEIATKMGIV